MIYSPLSVTRKHFLKNASELENLEEYYMHSDEFCILITSNHTIKMSHVEKVSRLMNKLDF